MSKLEIINVYHKGIQSVVTLVQGLSNQISDLSQTVEKQNNIISDLNTRLKRLEKQSKKTSKNSSLPPSTDGVKKTKSLHQPSTHTPGAQAGHKGTTLKRVETPDVILKHLPNTCLGCGETLENISVWKVIKRHVFDLPPLKLQVTEHQPHIKGCPNCGCKNEGQFPSYVTQAAKYGSHLTSLLSYLSHYQFVPYPRLKQLTNDILGANIRQGTLVNRIKRFDE